MLPVVISLWTLCWGATARASETTAPLSKSQRTALEKKLNQAHSSFLRKRELAKKKTLITFQKEIRAINQLPGLTPAARADRKTRWTEARDDFEKLDIFPPDDEFATIELAYFMGVSEAYAILAKTADEVIEHGNLAKDDELAALGVNLKDELEKTWLSETTLEPGSKWHGTFTRARGTQPYELAVHRVDEGGSFIGHVDDQYGVPWGWHYDVEGQRTGILVEFKLTKSTKGAYSSAEATGIISGDRLILDIKHVEPGFKTPEKGFLVLRRK